MIYETNCTAINSRQWNKLMAGARRFSYRKLVKLIKQYEPEMYEALALNFYNPYSGQTAETSTHFILVHSAIEYFFKKNGGGQ